MNLRTVAACVFVLSAAGIGMILFSNTGASAATSATVDFGKVTSEFRGTKTATIENRTDQPWRIRGVGSSCKCVSGRAQDLVCAAHGTCQVEVTFTARGLKGRQSRNVWLNLEESSPVTIEVTADVTTYLYVDPLQITIRIPHDGDSGEGRLAVHGEASLADNAVSAKVEHPSATAAYRELSATGDGIRGEIAVTVRRTREDRVEGVFGGEITFVDKRSGARRVAPFSVVVESTRAFDVSPALLMTGPLHDKLQFEITAAEPQMLSEIVVSASAGVRASRVMQSGLWQVETSDPGATGWVRIAHPRWGVRMIPLVRAPEVR